VKPPPAIPQGSADSKLRVAKESEPPAKFTSWPKPAAFHSVWANLAVLGAAFGFILLLTWPAFSGFFIGEDFIYYGFGRAVGGNIFRAAITPLNGIFFRPASVFWNLLFQSVLPAEPFVHHLRTYLMICVLAVMVWALLGRVVESWSARVAGFALFAISKVHLTNVGYINCNDSVMSAIHLVCLFYFLLVYLQTGARWSLWLSWVFFAMQAGSRDYGIVVLAPVLLIFLFETIQQNRWDWRRFTRLALPFFIIVMAYSGLRWWAVGKAPSGAGTVYALHFAPIPALYRAYLFGGNVLDLSLGESNTTGAGNFSDLLVRVAPLAAGHTRLLNLAFLAVAGLFLAALLVQGLWKDRRIVVPLTLVAVYMVPTFLILNIQIYYMTEALIGVALAVAMAFATLRRARFALVAWTLILCVAASGALLQSRNVRMFSWRFCANATQRAYDATIRPNIGRGIDKWLLLVADPRQRDFWSFNMTADEESPLVSVLMKNPGLTAHVMPPVPAAVVGIRDFSRAAIYTIDAEKFVRLAPPVIEHAAISETKPDGAHIVTVTGANFEPLDRVLFNGSPVESKVANARSLTAIIPKGSASGSLEIEESPLGWRSDTVQVELNARGTGKPALSR
jgi:hypothetical protein